MRVLVTACGIGIIVLVLVDAFESILQPRRVTHRFRYSRAYYRNTWAVWRALARLFKSPKRRESFLGIFGPLSMLGLFVGWVLGLILGFALIHWSLGLMLTAAGKPAGFWTCLELSGSTFFTMGYGDARPVPAGRATVVIEVGLGFAFLAIIISYLPVLYQAFSRREVTISLMDARAGSPPTAGELLVRLARARNLAGVELFLQQWEQWAAELLESHLSFPVLSYYRSQHDNQSWLAALTKILDTCAILLVTGEREESYQAQLTFAMARHAAVDLAQVVNAKYDSGSADRLPDTELEQMRDALGRAGLRLRSDEYGREKLRKLRSMYEPYVHATGGNLLLKLPAWWHAEKARDNWQAGPWDRVIQARGLAGLSAGGQASAQGLVGEDHF